MNSRVIKAAVAVALVASSVNAQTPEQARQYAIFKTSVGDFTCESIVIKLLRLLITSSGWQQERKIGNSMGLTRRTPHCIMGLYSIAQFLIS